MRYPGKLLALTAGALLIGLSAQAQLIDNTQAPNTAGAGINKSLTDEVGAGRGNVMMPNSSMYIINRDPFRSIRRGRQLFQRKFTQAQGVGPTVGDGVGDINTDIAIGAGLSDSCAGCHGRPRGSGGAGGNVATRPDSRDAPHLFGLGLKEMLADEMTTDLRSTRDLAVAQAQQKKRSVTLKLSSKGVQFGSITGNPDGSVNLSNVVGVDSDLPSEQFLPHVCNRGLGRVTRLRNIRGRAGLLVRIRKGAPVELAVRRQRQRIERDEHRRDHVGGQRLLE